MSATLTDVIPAPNTANYAARGVYGCLNFLAFMAGIVSITRAHSSLAVYGACILIFAPAFLACMEISIMRAARVQTISKNNRQLLFIGEMIQPLVVLLVLPVLPELLHVFEYTPSSNGIALIDITLMCTIGFGGIFANRRWTLNRLQLPR